MKSICRRATRCYVFLVLATLATAQGSSQQKEIEPFSDNAIAAYQAAAQQVTLPASADVVVLADIDEYRFESDGRSTYRQYLVYKVLTQKGVNDWDEISAKWEPWHQDRPIFRARVGSAGNIYQLDEKTITDAPAGSNDTRIYSDGKIVRAPLPAIAPGSLVERELIFTERMPFFGAGTVNRAYFGRFVPVQRTRLVLDAPAGFPLRYELKLLPEMKAQRSESNGRVRIVFESGPTEAQENAGNYLPSDVSGYPYVGFSTGASWQHVAEEYEKIVDDKIAKADVKHLVQQLVAGKTTREQRVAAILQYLSREIRYTGIEFGDAAIVPRTPNETLKRKYGDCKDKATLLIAMLRAAQIPAHVALLNAGSREDVSTQLPGMGTFDHAIVYAPGKPDLWIDPTDQYARLGQLPNSDQGRLALIARKGSKALLRIPEVSAQDNLLLEKRRFYLAENGPARIVEISEPFGDLESDYRRLYADKENKKQRENLGAYVKSHYLADNLDRFDRSDPGDLSSQFQLELEAKKAKRGFTDLESAAAAIRFENLFSRLPAELTRKIDDSRNNKSDDKPKKKRTEDYQLPSAFATEWRYEIFPPLGYRPKPLPQDIKMSLGPALLSAQFSADQSGVVRAVVRFDTVKRRLTVAEAEEMRDRIAELRQAQATLIYFEPVAEILFREGKPRESFAAYRKLIVEHPKEAVHHLQIANALLKVGMGEAAREEARTATRLEPDSALAHKTLAFILKHDLVGRPFRRGSDLAGAETALRTATKLDSEDKAAIGDLAILLEYNREGERYAPGAKLREAVETYRRLKSEDLAEIGLTNNLAFALMYAEDFAAAKTQAEALNPRPMGLIIAAESALHGSQAGIREAQRRVGAEGEMRDALRAAGSILMRMRKYSLAADLLQAGAYGENASDTVSLASMLRNTRPRQSVDYGNDPSGLVMKTFKMIVDNETTPDKMNAMESRSARRVTAMTDPEKREEQLNAGRGLRAAIAKGELPVDVALDLFMQVIEPKQVGDDASGYRVSLTFPGTQKLAMYVVKEDGNYKLLDSSEKTNAAGLEILDRVNAGNLPGARILLDWVREDQPLPGGDDPFAGGPFPRFWTRGKQADARQAKLAAAALLVQTKETANEGIPILKAALPLAKTEAEKANVMAALLAGYGNLNAHEKALPIATELAEQYPDSKQLFMAQILALQGLKRLKQADDLAEERLKRMPDDLDALRALSRNAAVADDYKLARTRDEKLRATGKAEAPDLNNLAWWSLFLGNTGEQDAETALKATRLERNSGSILHTLGCIYAEMGKVKEAREVLVQAMDILDLDEPNPSYWYAFGRIAEQYGELQIAASHYARVKKPKAEVDVPGSSYKLSQMRLKGLAALGSERTTPAGVGKP